MHRLATLRYFARRAIQSPPRPRLLRASALLQTRPTWRMVVRHCHSGAEVPKPTLIQTEASALREHISEMKYYYALLLALAVLVENRRPRGRMKPHGLLAESLAFLSENDLVEEYVGTPLASLVEFENEELQHSYLMDSDSKLVLRIKFRVRGPRGEATVYAQVVDGMEAGEYQYLLVEFSKDEVLEIVDNRQAAPPISDA